MNNPERIVQLPESVGRKPTRKEWVNHMVAMFMDIGLARENTAELREMVERWANYAEVETGFTGWRKEEDDASE